MFSGDGDSSEVAFVCFFALLPESILPPNLTMELQSVEDNGDVALVCTTLPTRALLAVSVYE